MTNPILAVQTTEKARWLRDLRRFLPLKPQFVVSGNVRHHQLSEVTPGAPVPVSLAAALRSELREAGFGGVLCFDPVNGFRPLLALGEDPQSALTAMTALGLQPDAQGNAPAGIELLAATLARVAARSGEPIALLIDFASRLIIRNDALSAAEHQAFMEALVASHVARSRPIGTPPRPFFNSIVWVVDKEGDLPDWFLIDNPRIRHIPVGKPDNLACGVPSRQRPSFIAGIKRRGATGLHP